MSSEDTAGLSFVEEVLDLLRPRIGSFRADVVPIVDLSGQVHDPECIVVHAAAAAGQNPVPLDAVAAVIECTDELSTDTLQSSYARTEALKLAKKTTEHSGQSGVVDMTTSVVCARRSTLSLEGLASEMAKLNESTSSQQWPDAVGVIDTGLVNYIAYPPGAETGGSYFLAAADTLRDAEPSPLSIVLTARAIGENTLNTLVSLVVARTGMFDPSAGVTDYRELLQGVVARGLPVQRYEYTLSCDLKPVQPAQEVAARLSTELFRISANGELLGSIQFFERQDGGIVVVRGGFPMEPVLIFISMGVPGLSNSSLGFMRNNGTSTSYLLPITRKDFLRGLALLSQRSSNVRIDRDTSRFIIQQTSSEGTSSLFVARLVAGLMEARDWAIEDDGSRRVFDDILDVLLSSLRDARHSASEIQRIWGAHREAVARGLIVQTRGNRLHISESIDRVINRELGAFLLACTRALKNALQKMSTHLGVEIGFIFQSQREFALGLENLRAKDPDLAKYLELARSWTAPLIKARNDLEHKVAPELRVTYDVRARPVSALEPVFEGSSVTSYVEAVLEQVLVLVEEVVIHLLAAKLPPGMSIAETPKQARNLDYPRRFVLTVSKGGRLAWRLPDRIGVFSEA